MLAAESIGNSLCNGIQESVNFNLNSIGNNLNGFGNGGGSFDFGNGGNNFNMDTNGFNFNLEQNNQFQTNCDNISNAHNAGLWTVAKMIAWTFPGDNFNEFQS